YRSSQRIEVSQPDGLVLIRARRVEILNHDFVLAEFVVETAVAEERKRVRRTPDLLAGLLRSKDPVVAALDRPKTVNEIARGEPAKSTVPIRVQQIGSYAAEFVHLHRITRRPRNPLSQPRHAPVLLEHDADRNRESYAGGRSLAHRLREDLENTIC